MAKRFKQDQIDELMKDAPLLPKTFGDWMRSTPFTGVNYMFYKRIKKKLHGYCSKCGELKIYENRKSHNDTGRCMNCKAKVTYKAINKAKSFVDDEIVSILQEMNDGYLIRYFKVRRIFKSVNDDTKSFPDVILKTLSYPSIGYYEGSRVYISFNKRGLSQYRYFEDAWSYLDGDCRWVNERKRGCINNKELLRASNPVMYKRNLKSVLKNSKWQYSGLNHFKGKCMNIDDYLSTYERYPAIEMLSKLNYQILLDQVIYRSCWWGGVSGVLKMNEKRLGLSSQVFNKARELNLKIEGIEFLNTLEEMDKKLSDKQILWAIKNTNTETFTQLLKWINPQKIINYVEKNTSDDGEDNYTGNSPYKYKGHFTSIWRDYLQMCERLELDTNNDFVLFPRNLKDKHDEFAELVKVKVSEELNQGIKVQYDKWNDSLSYRAGPLNIEVASSHELILKESQALRHCVGRASYAERMTDGKRLILFIRKNDKPFYTVEFDVEDMRVIQNRGMKNKDTNKEVKKFMNKWKVKKLMLLQKSKREAI